MAEVGRPKWVPENLEQVESLASRGLTLEQIAACLGIHVSTLYEKKKEYSDFAEAIKRGKAKGIAHVANKLIANAEAGNVTAQIFFLKTQAGWKETEVKVVTGGEEPVKYDVKLAAAEIDSRIASMLDNGEK